jgi:hypothetical protein
MVKVQHIWDWYLAVVEAKQNYVRFFTPQFLTGGHCQDGMDYRMMKDLKLIDARPEGRSVWELTSDRRLERSAGGTNNGADPRRDQESRRENRVCGGRPS